MGNDSLRVGVLRPALLVVGTVLGLWHCFVSLQSIFVMKDEWLLLFGVVFGPLLTLPAVLTSAWKPRIGGWILTVAAGVFLLTLLFHHGVELYQIGVATSEFVVPMVLLGAGFIWSAKHGDSTKALAPT